MSFKIDIIRFTQNIFILLPNYSIINKNIVQGNCKNKGGSFYL